MSRQSPSVAIVIAAFNSASTIHRAVRSALAEGEVSECIVVDDASSDATVSSAQEADDGTRRLKIIRLSQNGGPAAARNAALDVCSADYVSILDADDYFVGGRLRRLLDVAGDDDLVADDILIVPEQLQSSFAGSPYSEFLVRPAKTSFKIGLADFIRSNIPARGRPRAELGFLKPIIKRAFLEQTKLRYAPKLRLGEDYAFYVRALLSGARFRIVGPCGYIAVERSNSLSSRHTIRDLVELAAFDAACIENEGLTSDQRSAFREHLDATNKNIAFRRALQARSERGLVAGLITASRYPSSLGYMVSEALYARYRNIHAAIKTFEDRDSPNPVRLLIGEAGLR